MLDLRHSFRKKTTGISYSVNFTWDKEIFVDREEDILINGQIHPINLKWQLGQLFNK